MTTLYLFFLAQTLLRLRLMDLHELLGKMASQTVLAVILAAVFVVLTAWVKGNTSLYLFNTVLAAFVIGILLEPLRAKVEEQVVAHLLPRAVRAARARWPRCAPGWPTSSTPERPPSSSSTRWTRRGA